MIKKYILTLFSLSPFFAIFSVAQSTYSPYSMLGLGEIETRDYGRTAGMGGIGIGVRDYDYLNGANPASLTQLDSMKFIFDVSSFLKYSSYKEGSTRDNVFNGNMRKVAIGFKVFQRWALAAGVKPFSDVGYRIRNQEAVLGTTATQSVYLEGDGGLYNAYLINSFRLSKNLSIGVNTTYIAGTLKQTETHSDYYFRKEAYTNNFYNTFGLQYHNRRGLTIGLLYGYKQSLRLTNQTSMYNASGNLVRQEKDRSSSQFIPENFGAGFSLQKSKIIFGLDYEYYRWNGLSSGVSNIRIIDSYKIKAGAGIHSFKENYYLTGKKKQYQVGATFAKSYIQLRDKNAYNYSVTAGYSCPLNDAYLGHCLLNFSLEYGNNLRSGSGYIKESYLLFNVNFTLNEIIIKRKID